MELPPKQQKLLIESWAHPRPGMTLDELVTKMAELGNVVLDIDYENTRLLMQRDTVGAS